MTAPTKALAAVLIGLAFQVVASAAPRARFRAETILNDPVVRIAAGPDYACQVNDDGTVQCWGNNYLGQLGDARTAFRSTPALVPGVTGAIAVTAGTGFACALIVDETVRCWGGGLRLGGPTKIPGLFSVVAISAGDAHVCAIISPGFVRCLGYNFEGELGDPSAPQFSSAPVSVLNLFPTFPAVAIRSGYRYSCILSDQGTVLCWGRSKEVFYGNAIDIAAGSRHMCALISDGTVTCWGDDSQGQLGGPPFSPVAGVTRAVAVGVGPNHSCAVLAAGNAVCWGDGRAGQLGDGSTVTRQPTPVPVAGSTRFAAIVGGGDAEGRSHTCALLGDGSVRCWGANAFGQLGDGTTIPKSTPIAVLNSGGTFSARDLAAGSQHTCAARSNGSVACWGSNLAGQAAGGSTAARVILSPLAVDGISGVAALAAGAEHTCALLLDGAVRCWGSNASGQLGNGSTAPSSTPTTPSLPAEAISIVAGTSHSCALLADGSVRCWGANHRGQLGDRTTVARTTPVPVMSGVTAIAAGGDHTCALTRSANVACWGDSSSGQVGALNVFGFTSVPSLTFALSAVGVAAGDRHSCALLADGEVKCWGANQTGQLGDGTTIDRRLAGPVVPDLKGRAVALSAGGSHTCAVIATGGVLCWGANASGQLGRSGISFSALPVQVLAPPAVLNVFSTPKPFAGAVTVAAGAQHTCASTAFGGVSCWGEGAAGQLGLNSAIDQFWAVTVPSFTLNIDPSVVAKANRRVATATVLAVCEEGQRLFADVVVSQGAVSGRGQVTGECTGGLARLPATVPLNGPGSFAAGPVEVSASAELRDRGAVVETQRWTRRVNLVFAP